MERSQARGWRRGAVKPALALSAGVVGWEQALHAARGVETPGFWLNHALLDTALAVPLALFAILTARRVCEAAWGRALWAATVFSALLVPAVGAHERVHALLYGSAPASPGHAHGASVWPAPPGALAHGLRDAIFGYPVALAIAVALLGARRERRRRTSIVALATLVIFTMLPLAARAAPVITPFATPLPIPATLTSPDITLHARQADVPVLPGAPTTMWTYDGTFPGPTIRRPSGAPTHLTVVNDLPAAAGAITLHHHGNHSASVDDGQPANELIEPAGSHTYTYDFTEGGTAERGAMQWYHDHRMDVTGRNVWMGLAGMVILDDPAEASINDKLPHGDRDVPLMVVDRSFDASNQLSYAFNSEGKIGNAILVNGAPQPYFEVADAKYRLRILNASNMRSYDFRLSNGRPLIQVATESGLLPAPVARQDILLGPAERAEVIVDFSGELGKDVTLNNAAGFGPNLSTVMQFRVRRHEADTSSVPHVLRAAPAFEATQIAASRTWVFGRDVQTGEWTINNQGFDPARDDATPKLGTTEQWVFVNATDTDHIVHIHDVDWHIVSRTPTDPSTVSSALGEAGLRESFRLHPNEVVVIESRFTDHVGRYVLHCHLLEHEDFAMMAQFRVVA